jgi:AraC-like DNA-binding protein
VYDKSQNRASITFSEVEELEEVAQSIGWDIDYRQISKGIFSSELASLDVAETSLTTVNFNNDLHISCEAPEELVGFFLPRLATGGLTTCGTTVTDGELIVFPAQSEMDFIISGKVTNETVLFPEAEFRATAKALAPSATLSFPEATAIYQADPRLCAQMRREISSVLGKGCLDAEAVSSLLTMIVLWITDASSRSSAEQLPNGAAVAIARRAQAFIEDEYRNPIQLKDLCAHSGVGFRTLQRYFAAHFQMSPFEYINTLRMNETRRALVNAEPSVSTVTRIATSNGFSHLGRFSGAYRDYFSESPSETLAAQKP